MKLFRKKKKKDDPEEMALQDTEIIDFKEFEEFEQELNSKEPANTADVAKNFVFEIPDGCPICGGTVKGNEHYRFFCKQCNILYDKKDIIEEEFGGSIVKRSPVRKTVLSPKDKEDLEQKRKELSERVFNTFSEEEKEELKEQVEEEPVEEEISEDIEEVIDEEVQDEDQPEEDETPDEETEPDEEPEEEPDEEEPEPEETDEDEPDEDSELDEEDGPEIEIPDDDEADEEPDEEGAPEQEEYELEAPDHIIASSESDKLHKGDCHFVKKIHPDNRIYFDSIEQGENEGYNLCVCLRRLKAMQR